MSLIGIDLGSSSVKIAAYSEDGMLIAITTNALTPIHPAPGLWETDPEDIWQSISKGMRSLMAQESLKKDPPKCIAVSASGRENFPADGEGKPLGNGIMGADTRGEEFEILPEGLSAPETWCLSCGHLRERMDPIFRLEWWRKYHPEIIEKTKYYFGWIDFLTFRMTGRAVTDRSSASRYLIFDLESMDWVPERIAEYKIDPSILPKVLPWGTIIGELKPEVAKDWALPKHVKVAMGCHDLNCAALGAGVNKIGTVCLVSGSYENVLTPTNKLPTATMLLRGLSIMPQPCKVGLSVIAVHPTGNAVLNWIRELVSFSIEEMESVLGVTRSPSPVMAVPYLSGSMTYWENGRNAKGALIGLTLANSKEDIIQAFMESIAYDLVNSLSMMEENGIDIKRIRIMGGGARSSWWTQLKADMTKKPIEVVEHPEPGTMGAALLAGQALGIYKDLESTSKLFAATKTVYSPDAKRASEHEDRFNEYKKLMSLLLNHVY